MLKRRIVILLAQSISGLLFLLVGASGNSNWTCRPGTVQYALAQSDGSHVYLDSVKINKIRAQQTPSYVVVSEFFSYHDTLITLTQANPLLRRAQTVDMEGDLTTLDSGDRALTNVTVWGYTDSSGNLLYNGPLLKGIFEPTPWQWKVDLTVSPPTGRQRSDSTQQDEVSDDTPSEVLVCSSIAEAKSQDPGTVVELRCKPVSVGGSEAFTLGEDNSSDTITTNYTGSINQTDRICTVRGTVDTDGEDVVLDVDSGPDYNVQESYQGSLLAAQQGTILWAKSQYDTTQVSLSGKIITRVWPDHFYIEEDDRFSGIRVELTSHGHYSGERASVSGSMATNSDGERYIAATSVTHVGDASLNPVGMNNKLLGGGDVGYVAGNPASGQKGTIGGIGLNNIGVLVKTWGKITEIDSAGSPQWFGISDGSGFQTAVAYPPYGYALNDFVGIAGISSCEVDTSGNLQRVLRPQPLTVTINQASGQADSTTTSPINFTVVFSERVTGFGDDDVEISGSAGGTRNVNVTSADPDGRHYNVAVSNLTYGSVIANILPGKAVNASAVWNYASTSTDNTVTYRSNIVYVKTPGNGGNDNNSGLRWDNAKATISAALDTAVSCGSTQVWVARGTYNERIIVRFRKELYGGFAGTETSTSQRPAFPRAIPDSNETVIDGQQAGDVLTATNTNYYNVVDGFTIRNGNNGVSASSVLCIRNSRIVNNSSSGLSLSGSAPYMIYSNAIANNGGCAIYCSGSGNYTINGNRIESNGTAAYGGGICMWSCSGTNVIANNFIRDNDAVKGGGIAIYGSAPEIYGNTILDNTCSVTGGGIWIRNLINNCNVSICNNIIAINGGNGGVYVDTSNWPSTYTVFLNTNCTYQNGGGNYGSYDGKVTFTSVSYDYHWAPGFVSQGSYSLDPTSQCIDNGGTIFQGITRYYGSEDIDGQARISNSFIDIGCDEVPK